MRFVLVCCICVYSWQAQSLIWLPSSFKPLMVKTFTVEFVSNDSVHHSEPCVTLVFMNYATISQQACVLVDNSVLVRWYKNSKYYQDLNQFKQLQHQIDALTLPEDGSENRIALERQSLLGELNKLLIAVDASYQVLSQDLQKAFPSIQIQVNNKQPKFQSESDRLQQELNVASQQLASQAKRLESLIRAVKYSSGSQDSYENLSSDLLTIKWYNLSQSEVLARMGKPTVIWPRSNRVDSTSPVPQSLSPDLGRMTWEYQTTQKIEFWLHDTCTVRFYLEQSQVKWVEVVGPDRLLQATYNGSCDDLVELALAKN